MRLAVILFYVHFFISGMLGQQTSGRPPGVDVSGSRCSRALAPLIVAAQAYDVANTRNQLARYPGARESDWWSEHFAGRQRRNVVGIALGIALLDVIKWRLTAHSPELRCIVEINQIETTLTSIQLTRPR